MARDNAAHCEAKKHAYRQTQDGVVVSFVLHPQDVPQGLALASLGTRYMLAMVEIGDDEQPKEVMPPEDSGTKRIATPPHAVADNAPRGARTKSAAQQAGILCNEPQFIKWIGEQYGYIVENPDQAAGVIRELCEVESRRDIREGTEAWDKWRNIVGAYKAWQMAPSVGAA